MRRIAILLALILILSAALPAQAGPPSLLVTPDEAWTVAANWIAQILHCHGNWGGSATAQVEEVREFRRGDRLLGYICRVQPHGFIVVSLRRELEPIKAYSETSDLNPDSDDGLADVVKGGMERILNAIETRVGPVSTADSGAVQEILETNYRENWERLGVSTDLFSERLASGSAAMGYCEEGGILIKSAWHQDAPYNYQCPPIIGSNPCRNAVVGCMATAAAQIMRYWAWPPYGVDWYSDPYDWTHMANQYIWSDGHARWEDEAGNALTQTHLDAAAELSHEVGEAGGVSYGCDSTGGALAGVPGKDMLDAYEDHFRYDAAAGFLARGSLPASTWFAYIKSDLNKNRPIQYRIDSGGFFKPLLDGHSIIVDGWRETGGLKQYHMNYGWGSGLPCDGYDCNCWYTLDTLYGSENITLEMMIVGLRPQRSLGTWLSGMYAPPAFPYRYFDRNATGNDAAFDAGQYLQFLSGVKVACTGTRIAFYGWSTANTRLFSRGDPTTGIRIHSGHVYLFNGGGIRMY